MELKIIKYLMIFTIILMGCTQKNKHIKPKKSEIESFSDFKEFIPKGYIILDSIYGNINLDNYSDLILILKIKNEDSLAYEELDITLRPFLILAGDKTNKFKLIARNDSLVLCLNCGGMFGDPYSGAEINNGIIKVNHYGGSNERWTNNLTFRYDKKDKSIYVDEIEQASFNILKIEDENEDIDNYIEKNTIRHTRKDFGNVKIEYFSNDF